MIANQSAFPVSTSSQDKDGTVFSHEIVGGLTAREYVAIEFAKAFFSNAAMIASRQSNSAQLRTFAILQADLFIKELNGQPLSEEETGK